MIELRGFNDQATPVFADLGDAAPSITGATEALGPLADAATPALTSLGDALEEAAPDLVASNPVLRDVADLANASARPAKNLQKLLGDLREKGGYERPARLPLQLRRLGQRHGPVRPLPAHAVPRLELHRLRDRAAHRLRGQLHPAARTRAAAAAAERPGARTAREPSCPELDAERWQPPRSPSRARCAGSGPRARGPLRRRRRPRSRGERGGAALDRAASLEGADELFRFLMEDAR